MTIGLATSLRNAICDAINTAMNAGSGAAFMRWYSGTRPATGGTVTTLLAELTFSDPAAPSASGGVLTASTITSDTSADASGTATWGRIVDSAGTFVMDFSIGTSGADLNLNSVVISAGQACSVTSATWTAPNA